MKAYSIHFHVDMGYDLTVIADTEEEAGLMAEAIFEALESADLEYIDSDYEIVQVSQCNSL